VQPASSGGGASGSGSRALRKWGPIAAVVVVAAVVIGVIVAAGGGDDDSSDTQAPVTTATPGDTSPPDDTGSVDTSPPDTGAPGEIPYPLSFSEAEELGIEVDWGERCDTELGTLRIKNFFAPECYAPFEGDNGGATATGVTADSIKVVWYQGPDDDPVINYITDAISVDDTNAQEIETVETFLELYEQFYEFYGRTIELVPFEGSGIASDEVSARADAVRIAEDIQPFAVLGGPALTSAFADELSARGVLCVSCTPGQPPEWYVERDPYVWGLGIGARQSRQHVTEWIGKQLVGKNAEYAGDPAFQSQPRTFGLVALESSAESKEINDAFAASLRGVGAEVVEVLPYQLDPATIQASAAQVIGKLKAAGVTSVVFVGDPIAPRDFTREATAQEYFPEWIIAAPALVDTTAFARTYDQRQWAHAFGVTHLSARNAPENRGFYSLYRWFTGGQEPPAPDTIEVFMPQLALFTAVLQGAGPNLTPETWRDALFAGIPTRSAISQPSLSWGDKGIWDEPDYSGVDDATLIWWDPEATGPDEIRREGTGMYQYVDGGTRYLPGEWPTEEKLFDPEGAVALYDEAPPGEEPPDYPSPNG
jgi:hypothetical protein